MRVEDLKEHDGPLQLGDYVDALLRLNERQSGVVVKVGPSGNHATVQYPNPKRFPQYSALEKYPSGLVPYSRRQDGKWVVVGSPAGDEAPATDVALVPVASQEAA